MVSPPQAPPREATCPPHIEGASIGSPRPIEDASPEGQLSFLFFYPSFVLPPPPAQGTVGCCMPFRGILSILAAPFVAFPFLSSLLCCAGLPSAVRGNRRGRCTSGDRGRPLLLLLRSRFCTKGAGVAPLLELSACPTMPSAAWPLSSSSAASSTWPSRTRPPADCFRPRPAGGPSRTPPPSRRLRPRPAGGRGPMGTPRHRVNRSTSAAGATAHFGRTLPALASVAAQPTAAHATASSSVGAGSSRWPPLRSVSSESGAAVRVSPMRARQPDASALQDRRWPLSSLHPSPS